MVALFPQVLPRLLSLPNRCLRTPIQSPLASTGAGFFLLFTVKDWVDIIIEIAKALMTGTGALAGLLLGTVLALRKFESEKRWEQKHAAYGILFQNLQDILYVQKQLAVGGLVMTKKSDDAYDYLFGQMELGAWILEEETLKAIRDMVERVRVIKRDRPATETYEANSMRCVYAIIDATQLIRAHAKEDLRETARGVKIF